MKILMFGPSLEERGGVATVIKCLRDALSKDDANITLMATTSSGGLHRRLLSFLITWARLLGIALGRRTDIAHLHMASRGSCLRKSLLALTCFVTRTRYVIHLHGAEFKTFYGNELGSTGRWIVRFVFHRASRVIALSTEWRTWLQSAMNLSRVEVVFNGVTAPQCSIRKPGSPTVLFLGRLGSRKGTDQLISAMRLVVQSIPNAILELGGDGDIESYRRQAEDLPNVRFLGWIGDAERSAALSRASVFCLPSWNEGLPMSVLEAMSCGLPVVSTPVGGIPEAVLDGVTGLLVQPGDVVALAAALTCLLGDNERASEMGGLGQTRHREHFSAEAMAKGCLAIYSASMAATR